MKILLNKKIKKDFTPNEALAFIFLSFLYNLPPTRGL